MTMWKYLPAGCATNSGRNRISTFTPPFRLRGNFKAMTFSSITEPTERQAAQQVVENDLEYIAANLAEEFPRLAGRRLLITGGAGFLGHYLVQSALYWNRTRSRSEERRVGKECRS